jgi:hypothetical protein
MGVYWKPVWHILEGHLALILVNAAHVKNVPGRKSDVNGARRARRIAICRLSSLRLKARRGAKKAAIAVAASILTTVYHMLRDGTYYQGLGPEYFARRNPKGRSAGRHLLTLGLPLGQEARGLRVPQRRHLRHHAEGTPLPRREQWTRQG